MDWPARRRNISVHDKNRAKHVSCAQLLIAKRWKFIQGPVLQPFEDHPDMRASRNGPVNPKHGGDIESLLPKAQ